MSFQENLLCWECIYYIPIFILLTTLPFTTLLSLTLYAIAYLVSCFNPNLGQFLSCTDVLLDEDFVNSTPKSSLVISLTLHGDLQLEKLRTIFTENVLEARSKVNSNKLRYPQLKQYLTMFMCFQIWQNDPGFRIENHIVEKFSTDCETDLGIIHQEYMNKSFEKYRSPWELTLIRNENNNDDTSVLVFRVPHVMADAKSLIKLLVECLGNQQLKTASPVYIRETRWDYFRFILCFPFKCICEGFRMAKLLHSSFDHPWKLQDFFQTKENIRIRTNKTIVAFSSKISILNLKLVAKENNVKTSAVLMSIIAGAVRKTLENDWDKEVTIGFPSPKPNHPEKLANHSYLTVLRLPTNQPDAFKRLQQCNQEFVRTKEEQQGRYSNIGALLGGLQIYPINRIFVNAFGPVALTNIAGEEDGFSVGNAECVDFRMSVGTLRGVAGVVFCILSYKDGIRIAVIANESVLTKRTAENLTKQIDLELQLLLRTANNN